jgi:hypothetical protein
MHPVHQRCLLDVYHQQQYHHRLSLHYTDHAMQVDFVCHHWTISIDCHRRWKPVTAAKM